MQLIRRPARAVPGQGREQRGVVGDVVSSERRNLIPDLMGRGLEAQMWIPHSVLAVPAQRPLRGSAPSATLTVQVRQPIDG